MAVCDWSLPPCIYTLVRSLGNQLPCCEQVYGELCCNLRPSSRLQMMTTALLAISCKWIHTVCQLFTSVFCFCFLLSIMFSVCLHCSRHQHLILFYGWISFHMWIDHILLMHPMDGGHLGCFHLLAIVNSATINVPYMYLPEYLFYLSLHIQGR